MGNPNVPDILAKVDEFVTGLDELISNKSSDEALEQIFDDNNEELIKLASMDILNLIGARLRNRNCVEGDVNEWFNLESILDYVVTVSKPKEMLISLLSLLEIAESDDFFKLILRPLRTVFIRQISQRGETLLWAFNSIYEYIMKIPIPNYIFDLEGDEKMTLENSLELNRLVTCVSSILTFCEPFVSEATKCKLILSSERREELILAIISFLLKLIERPVAYFEFSAHESPESKFEKLNREHYDCVERLISMLFDSKADFLFDAILWQDSHRLSLASRFSEDDVESDKKLVNHISLGILASIIYGHGICIDRLPQIYSNDYIFERLLPYANGLLKNGQNSILIGLGLDYLENIRDRLYSQYNLGIDNFWERQRLNCKSYQELFLNLINVMNYANQKTLRQRALKLFTDCLGYFEPYGRILIIRLVFFIFEHQEGEEKGDWYFANKGICGYLIDYYRGALNKELSQPNSARTFFHNIDRMTYLFTRLDHKEETDFLDNFERYMAALNLIRFLCMIHLNGKCIFSNQLFAYLSRDFAEPMRKGLDISKAHYELDLKKAKEEIPVKRSDAQHMQVIANENEKIRVLELAINSFDLMASILARVSELLDSCLKVE